MSATTEKAGFGSRAASGSVSQWYGSADKDPYENVKNPQHGHMHVPILRLHIKFPRFTHPRKLEIYEYLILMF